MCVSMHLKNAENEWNGQEENLVLNERTRQECYLCIKVKRKIGVGYRFMMAIDRHVCVQMRAFLRAAAVVVTIRETFRRHDTVP